MGIDDLYPLLLGGWIVIYVFLVLIIIFEMYFFYKINRDFFYAISPTIIFFTVFCICYLFLDYLNK